MKIEWEWRVPQQDTPQEDMQRVADCAERCEGLLVNFAVHLILTDDEDIHQLNREYRGVDRATDVLSFPTIDYPKGKTAHDVPALLRREYDPDEDACMLGDIVISLPHARAQAEEYGHSVRRELCYLLVHGLHHLFGYDHMTEGDKRKMRPQEEKALRMAGVTREEPITDETLLQMAREAMLKAYAPYSHYRVGACLLAADGRLFTGCNVENAAYGLSNCAERTALFKAVSEGARSFVTIAIAAESSAPWPCGACRQALSEFAPDLRVLVTWQDGQQTDEEPLSKLLPHSFGPLSLQDTI